MASKPQPFQPAPHAAGAPQPAPFQPATPVVELPRPPGNGWMLLDDAVDKDKPLYLTADPSRDAEGILAEWYRTRVKIDGKKGWQPTAHWRSVLTRRKLDFVPFWWREAQ